MMGADQTGKTKNEKQVYLGLALLAAIVVVFPVISLKLPFYQPDDYLMNYIVNGSLFGGEDNLIYSNVLYGFFLNWLYTMIPAVNWYAVVMLGIIIISIYWILLIAYDSKNEILTASVLCIGYVIPFYFTFTVVSYMAIASGTIKILYLAEQEQRNYRKYMMPILLVMLGYSIRSETFLSAVVLFVPFVFSMLFESEMIELKHTILAGVCLIGAVLLVEKVWIAACFFAIIGWTISRKGNRKIKPVFSSFCVILIGMAVLTVVQVNYEKNNEWEEFRKYTISRSEVLDSPYVSYEDAQEELEKIGISKTEYELLWNWIFVDKGVYSKNKLDEIADILSKYPKIPILAEDLIKPDVFLCFLLPLMSVIILIFFKRVQKDRWWMLFCSLGILWGLYGILWVKRRFVFRVSFPLCIICIIAVFAVIGREKLFFQKGKKGFMLMIVSGVILCLVQTFFSFSSEKTEADVNLQILRNYIANAPDTHYLIDSSLYNQMYYNEQPMLSIVQTDMFDNVIKSGGGDSFSPRYYNQIENWFMENPDRTLLMLVHNENFKYIGRKGDLLKIYLSEQIDGNVMQKELLEIDDISICEYIAD